MKKILILVNLAIAAFLFLIIWTQTDRFDGHAVVGSDVVGRVAVPREPASEKGDVVRLILKGGNAVPGELTNRGFSLRLREVQVNPLCLSGNWTVQIGDQVEFAPFEDVVVRGVVEYVQLGEGGAYGFSAVVPGISETFLDVTVFNGRISVRYDQVGVGRRYVLGLEGGQQVYQAVEIDSLAEDLARKENFNIENAEAADEHHFCNHAVGEDIPEAADGRTIFGGKGFEIGQLPECRFKRSLLALTSGASERALDVLTKGVFTFHLHDLVSLHVSSGGSISYRCRFPRLKEGNEPVFAATATVSGASVPVSLPPIRHSRPGASKVLFLDFNGHDIALGETKWEDEGLADSPPWDCRAWSADGDRTMFSDLEQDYIIEVWARVAEDFAPFDVDVATEFPGAWGKNVGHALFTPETDASGKSLPHDGYGGIAYVDVFGDPWYSYNYSGKCHSPVFVTTYGNYDYYSAEAATHELGHNLGLSHDGSTSGEYYGGHQIASGNTHYWNAIMGGGIIPDVSQWSKGDYYNSNQSQDDLEIIAASLGYRPDDHGDDQSSASSLGILPTGGSVSDSGVIETTDDPDVFVFTSGAGQVSIQASTYKRTSLDWGSNLDILLELRDSSGGLVASSNPQTDVQASITTTVLSYGTYYLYVKPVGLGSPEVSPAYGYTSYGSLGNYALSGTLPTEDIDGDGLPNGWELEFYGSETGANPQDLAANGVNTVLQAYIAGFDPTDPSAGFYASMLNASGNIVQWLSLSGRVYSVYWTDDLMDGFLPDPVASGISGGAYTDSLHSADSEAYYRIEVEMAP